MRVLLSVAALIVLGLLCLGPQLAADPATNPALRLAETLGEAQRVAVAGTAEAIRVSTGEDVGQIVLVSPGELAATSE